MEEFAELLGCSSKDTLNFFFSSLQDIAGPRVSKIEVLYNAGVLAHFSRVSLGKSRTQLFANLSDVYDEYVQAPKKDVNEFFWEEAAVKSLLLAGFFQDQMRDRHVIGWYKQLGRRFFMQAGEMTLSPSKKTVLLQMSSRFVFWADKQCELSREMRDNPYIIKRRPAAN